MASIKLSEFKNKIDKVPINSRGHRKYKTSLKKEIVEYAIAKKISKKKLSQKIGVSPQTLNQWFKNFKKPIENKFHSIKIRPKESQKKKIPRSDKETMRSFNLPKGFILLGDAQSMADFMKGFYAPVSR